MIAPPRRKRIRRFNARLTTLDLELVRKLCRELDCSASELVRLLVRGEAERRGLALAIGAATLPSSPARELA